MFTVVENIRQEYRERETRVVPETDKPLHRTIHKGQIRVMATILYVLSVTAIPRLTDKGVGRSRLF